MKTKAALQGIPWGELRLTEVDLEEPRDDEVLVHVEACGVCHTDMMMLGQRSPYSILLGHEGSGVVKAVGKNVKKVAVGDSVIASYTWCGKCAACRDNRPYECENIYHPYFSGFREDGTSPVSKDGKPIGALIRQGAFAKDMVCSENALTVVDKDLDIRLLAPLGCGVMTGAGSVWNYLKPEKHSKLVILGFGGVGFGALCAAVNAGCSVITVVEKQEERRKIAKEIGADYAIPPEQLPGFCTQYEKDYDYLFDSTGDSQLLTSVERLLADKAVGCGSAGGRLYSHRFESIDEGHSIPQKMIPLLVEWYREGKLPLAEIVSFYPFDIINSAIRDMEAQTVIKPVLIM